MRIDRFEEKVWKIEGVRIVVRAATHEHVEDYEYKNAAQERWSVTRWVGSRIAPSVQGREVTVLDGTGEEPHGRTTLLTLRNSYGE